VDARADARTGRRFRALRWAIAAVVVATAVAVYLVERDGAVPGPVSLLATRPAFPRAWPDYADGSAAGPVDWRITQTRTTDVRTCELGSGAFRAWSYTAELFDDPEGFQTVCTYKSELLARAIYKWQSLYRVAGEDWPNFESWSDSPATPKNDETLNSHADEWEIGCGLGDPDGRCQVWVFRGRYGRVLMVVDFYSDVGAPGKGIPFSEVRVFVRSLDRDVAAKLRRG
jgi:hypothetical protein